MLDQATELRKLTVNQGRRVSAQRCGTSRLVVVSGGKGGIGVTSIAVNLATALASHKQTVLLVEVDDSRTDISTLCGLAEDDSQMADRSSSSDLQKNLQTGPDGLHVLPALWTSPDQPHAQSTTQTHHLFQQLHQLKNKYQFMVADVGNRTHGLAGRLWESADDLLLVTTSDPIAIMNSYTTLKTQSLNGTTTRIHSIVNYARSSELATNVHQRIDSACRRFLGFPVHHLGSLPDDPRMKQAAEQATPLVKLAPETTAAQALRTMAQQLIEQPSIATGTVLENS